MKDVTIQDVMERVIKANVRGTQADHRVAFIEELESSAELRALEHAYVFKNLYGLMRDRVEEVAPGNVVTKPRSVPTTPILPMSARGAPAASILPLIKPPVPTYVPRKRQDVSGLVAEIKNAVLMDFILPNGKKIRDASFGDLRDTGGWLTEIGLQRPRHYIVGNYLTEKDLHNVFLRVAA